MLPLPKTLECTENHQITRHATESETGVVGITLPVPKNATEAGKFEESMARTVCKKRNPEKKFSGLVGGGGRFNRNALVLVVENWAQSVVLLSLFHINII